MFDLMIEMAGLLERLAGGQRVAPEEARRIKDRLVVIRDDFRRGRQEQEPEGVDADK